MSGCRQWIMRRNRYSNYVWYRAASSRIVSGTLMPSTATTPKVSSYRIPLKYKHTGVVLSMYCTHVIYLVIDSAARRFHATFCQLISTRHEYQNMCRETISASSEFRCFRNTSIQPFGRPSFGRGVFSGPRAGYIYIVTSFFMLVVQFNCE